MRQVVAQSPRQHGADDAARRSTSDDVDHNAQFDAAADVPQQVEIHLLGVVLGIASVKAAEERRCTALLAIGNTVQRARGADEFQDFLADAMHIDGERHAAEAHQRNAKFFLAQGSIPQPG